MPQTYEQRKARKLRLIAEAIAGTTPPDFTPAAPAATGGVVTPVVTPAVHLTPAKPMRVASLAHPVVPHDDDPDFAPAAPAVPVVVVTPAAAAVPAKVKTKVLAPVDCPVVPLRDAAWAAWLASDQGRDCTDPRQPNDPLRRSVDLEARLHIAFVAGVDVLTTGGVATTG